MIRSESKFFRFENKFKLCVASLSDVVVENLVVSVDDIVVGISVVSIDGIVVGNVFKLNDVFCLPLFLLQGVFLNVPPSLKINQILQQ